MFILKDIQERYLQNDDFWSKNKENLMIFNSNIEAENFVNNQLEFIKDYIKIIDINNILNNI